MAKAQAEFTTGVMKNETVRQAAGMYVYFKCVYLSKVTKNWIDVLVLLLKGLALYK